MVSETKTQAQISELEKHVSSLQKDISVFTEYFGRMDKTVEKISDLTVSMHRMITLHEERITVQKKDDEDLHTLIELRKKETEESLRKIEASIQDHVNKLTKKIEEQNQKLWKLDAKRGSILGGLIVIAFILGPALTGFFEAYFSGNFLKMLHP